jgi:chitodextrinase
MATPTVVSTPARAADGTRRTRAMAVALLLALLAALAPWQPAPAVGQEDPEYFDGYLDVSPWVWRPGEAVVVDLVVHPSDPSGPGFLTEGATVHVSDEFGDPPVDLTVPVQVLSPTRGRVTLPALAENYLRLEVRSGGLVLDAYVDVREPYEEEWAYLRIDGLEVGATRLDLVSSAGFMTEETTLTTVEVGDWTEPRDVTDDSTFTRTDAARGTLELPEPLEAGDELRVVLSGPEDLTFEGVDYVQFPDAYNRTDLLLAGATTGDTLEIESYAFTFDGSETVRLRSYQQPIPANALGTPTLGDDGVLRVPVTAELELGSYDVVVTTRLGRFSSYLQVVAAGIYLQSDPRLIRDEREFTDGTTDVYLRGLGQDWDDDLAVDLVDLGGGLAATGEVDLWDGGPRRQDAWIRLDLTGVADGLHRLRITDGGAVDDSIAVHVGGPRVQGYVYDTGDEDLVEIWPDGFDLDPAAEVTARVRDRDGALVAEATGLDPQELFEVPVGGRLGDEVYRAELVQSGRTYHGRFSGSSFGRMVDVDPASSPPGSRPDRFTLRDTGGDWTDTAIVETTDWRSGRQIRGPLPERLDRERLEQRYPGGLDDGWYGATVHDEVYGYGWFDVGDVIGPSLSVEPYVVPSTPATLTLVADGFSIGAADELSATLSGYDWGSDESYEIDGVGDVRRVDATTLEVDITVALPEDDGYYLEVDINGAIFPASFYVGDFTFRWMYADPSWLPSGFAPRSIDVVADGFTIPTDADIEVGLVDSAGDPVVDAIGAVTRAADGSRLTVEITRTLPDDDYELVVDVDADRYFVWFTVGAGAPYAYTSPFRILPDEAATVRILGNNTSWTADAGVKLFRYDGGWGSGASPAADIAGVDDDPSWLGDDVSDAIREVRFVGPGELSVDLDPLEEASYVFQVVSGGRTLYAWLDVRVPVGLTVTPSSVDPRTLPRTLAVSALNLDLTTAEVEVWSPTGDVSGWFTATGADVGIIAVPADAEPGWYWVEAYGGGRYASTAFRIVGTSVSVSPSVFTDASSDGRTLAVTARGFDLASPTVTLTGPDGAVPITSTVRWWERLDVLIGAAMAPGRYTLTVSEGGSTATTSIDVVAAPAPGDPPVPPRVGVSAGTPGTVTTDPATGLVTVTVGAFELDDDVTIDFPIPGCPPASDIVSVWVRFNGQNVETDVNLANCTGTATIPQSLIRGDGGGTITVVVEREDDEGEISSEETVLGEIVLYDPAGIVTDAVTGDPIEGAVVTLLNAPGLVPATGATTGEGECESSASVVQDPETGRNLWSQVIGLGDGVVEPGDSARIEPRPAAVRQDPGSKNPLVTTASGYYGWDVAEGCWFVQVTATGYDTVVSPVVGIGPLPLEEVTDLDLALQPSTVEPPPDTTPPVWPGGSALTVDGVTTDQVLVTWPAATDADSPPVRYQVLVDGTAVTTATLTGTSHTVTGLTPDTSYEIAVHAFDSAETPNRTEVPLVTTTRTASPPDTTPPTFGSGSLTASAVTRTSLTLAWPAATDDRPGAVTYTVTRDGTTIATGVSATTLNVTGLTAGTTYAFAVTARDAAGNVTPTPLTRSVTTQPPVTSPPGPRPPTCAGVTLVRYPDVPTGYTHARAIGCAGGLGLVLGRPGGVFEPNGTLTRGQLASIVLRSLEASDVELTQQAGGFRDIAGSPHETAIRKLAARGIILGRDARTFDPQGQVTRAQMASIIDRASRELLVPYPQVAGPRFTDATSGPHVGAIDRLNAGGVVEGLSGGRTFGPNQNVRRGQAASIVMRWLEDQAVRLR